MTEIKKEANKKKWKVGKKENEIESKKWKKYYFRLVIGTERV